MVYNAETKTIDGSVGLYVNGKKTAPVLYALSDIPASKSNTAQAQRKIANFAARENLPVLHNPCPADKVTKREDVKKLIKQLEGQFPDLKKHVFGGIQRLPLPGWEREI